jgi:threonine 3-dehydrogenase
MRGLTASSVVGNDGGGYMMTGHRAKRGTGKVLVTGAVGQVGQELVPYLRTIHGDENVIASDVRSPPSDLYNAGPFQYIDVLEMTQLSRLVVEENVQCIVHLAAVLSATGEKHPHLALKINNEGTQNIFELARLNNIKVFCPSTIAVFGPTTPRDNTPDDCIMRPTTMYGLTKIHTELLGEYYHKKFGVDFRSLRYPGVISSKSMPGGGTTDYAVEIYHEALERGEYTCFLSEDTSLPMIYMPDLLKATIGLMEADPVTLKRRVYNLGALAFTPATLTKAIQKEIPDFKMHYEPDFRQAIADTWPKKLDDTFATEDWGWQPDYDVEAMTKEMLKDLRATRALKAAANK